MDSSPNRVSGVAKGKGRGRGFGNADESNTVSPLRKPLQSAEKVIPERLAGLPDQNFAVDVNDAYSSVTTNEPELNVKDIKEPTDSVLQQIAALRVDDSFISDAANEPGCLFVMNERGLNINAKEFVPTSSPSTEQYSLSPELAQTSLSPEAVPFYPSSVGSPGSDMYADDAATELVPADCDEDDMDPMLCTEQTLTMLVHDPACFDSLVPSLTHELNQVVKNQRTLQNIADVIVDFSISQPYVAYICARLCSHLNLNLVTNFDDNFRQCLLRKCQQTTTKLLPLHTVKLRLFTIFMAEIFTSMQDFDEHSQNMVNHQPLAKGVKRLLSGLLTCPKDDDIKYVVQTLKLCGAALEDLDPSPSEGGHTGATVATIMADVAKCKDAPENASYKRMLDALIELHKSNWGRVEHETAANTQQPSKTDLPMNGVTYDSSGQPLPEESSYYDTVDENLSELYASEFIGGDMQMYGTGNGDGNDNRYDDDPEMDEEISNAYLLFCEETHQMF